MKADHVIIGGINGLVAAALLSGRGGKVVLVERSARIGGCMTSDAVTLPDFTHDVMAATFVLFLTGAAFKALGPDLERHGLEALNSNLMGGDPHGGACTSDQFFAWRPFPGTANHRTPIKNIYHIGASTHPGPGLSGGSGFLVAKELA